MLQAPNWGKQMPLSNFRDIQGHIRAQQVRDAAAEIGNVAGGMVATGGATGALAAEVQKLANALEKLAAALV
jgi:hypothetical protein